MATFTPAKLCQVALTSDLVAIYTPSTTITQIQVPEMWFANTSTSVTHKVYLGVHGNTSTSYLIPGKRIPYEDVLTVHDSKIILTSTDDKIWAKVDTGTAVIATVYGLIETT